eukprot:jgi/Chrzof1/12113/Cz06g21250.t1
MGAMHPYTSLTHGLCVHLSATPQPANSDGRHIDIDGCSVRQDELSGLKEAIRRAKEGCGQIEQLLLSTTLALRAQEFAALLSQCGKQKNSKKALEVFNCMSKHFGTTLKPNTYVYTALISALSQGGEWQQALQQFEHMKKQAAIDPDSKPNEFTYSAVISACARGGDIDQGLALYQEMREAGLRPDTIIYSSVINACEKANIWDKVEEFIITMHEEGLVASTSSYTMLLDHHNKRKDWWKAFSLFEELQEAGGDVTTHMCSQLLQLFISCGKPKLALILLREMDRVGMADLSDAFTQTLQLTRASGLSQAAALLVKRMQRKGFHVSPAKVQSSSSSTASHCQATVPACQRLLAA